MGGGCFALFKHNHMHIMRQSYDTTPPLEQVKSYDIFSEVGYYIFVVVCGGACRVGWPLVALRLAQLATGPVVVAARPHEQIVAVLHILLVLSR